MQGLVYRALMNMPYYVWHDPTYPFVLPQINWQVMSHEQRVAWLTCNIAGLIEYANKQTDNINLLDADIEKLAKEFEKFKESGFDDYYEAQVAEWINNNLEFIFKNVIKQIYFALDDTGHLIAFIPESWKDINFFTPMDYSNQETYGHLQILLNDVVPYIEEEFEIVRKVN